MTLKQQTQNHVTNNHISKPKGPPPPPPLGVAPYLPPLRSQSQPPPMVRFSSIEFSSPPKPIYYKPANQTCWYQRPPEQVHINRPMEPPPPVPPSVNQEDQLPIVKSPPKVPYDTRPQLSDVAYLKKKFEEKS